MIIKGGYSEVEVRLQGMFRARWGVIDQGLSSLTNFAVTAAAARQGTPAEFGGFSLALALYIVFLWVGRSLVAEPFVVRLTESPKEDQRSAGREAAGAAVDLGILAGGLMVAISLLARASWSPVILAMAISLPALLAQDTYRYVLIAAGRTRSAAVNDGVWLAVQSALIGVILANHGRVELVTTAFGAGAAAGAILGAIQTGVRPRLGSSWRWMKQHGDLGVPLLFELITINGMPLLTMLGIAWLGGVTIAGDLRAGILLLSPATVVCSGVFVVGLPTAVRERWRSISGVPRLVTLLAASTTFITLAWAVVVLMIPQSLGEDILGVNWTRGRSVLPPVILLTIASAWSMAGIVGLRAVEGVRRSLRTRIWAAPLTLVSGLLGAHLGGALAAAGGLALAGCVSAGLTWISFREALRHPSLHAAPGLVRQIPDGYLIESES